MNRDMNSTRSLKCVLKSIEGRVSLIRYGERLMRGSDRFLGNGMWQAYFEFRLRIRSDFVVWQCFFGTLCTLLDALFRTFRGCYSSDMSFRQINGIHVCQDVQ
jgi:hypothetical protein